MSFHSKRISKFWLIVPEPTETITNNAAAGASPLSQSGFPPLSEFYHHLQSLHAPPSLPYLQHTAAREDFTHGASVVLQLFLEQRMQMKSAAIAPRVLAIGHIGFASPSLVLFRCWHRNKSPDFGGRRVTRRRRRKAREFRDRCELMQPPTGAGAVRRSLIPRLLGLHQTNGASWLRWKMNCRSGSGEEHSCTVCLTPRSNTRSAAFCYFPPQAVNWGCEINRWKCTPGFCQSLEYASDVEMDIDDRRWLFNVPNVPVTLWGPPVCPHVGAKFPSAAFEGPVCNLLIWL